MEQKHTEGKWRVNKYVGGDAHAEELRKVGLEPTRNLTNDGDAIVTSPNGPIAEVRLRRDDVKRTEKHLADDPERDANARLIAACPLMLKAIEHYLNGGDALTQAEMKQAWESATGDKWGLPAKATSQA